ncbi:MAG: hypothetical protein ACREK5_02455 [Gemmatimonadota bacterium]
MYEVVVADNYHYQDEEYECPAGRFRTWEEAMKRCMEIVDESLRHLHEPGISAEQLWNQYVMFGEDPFIVPAGDERFSAWEYARDQCAELCEG